MKDNRKRRSILSRPGSLREWGQTIALMAIALPAVLGASGLAVDVGNYYYNDHKYQSALDAAVLSGAQCLPTGSACGGTSPSTVAMNYATANGISSPPTPVLSCTSPTCAAPNYDTITMNMTKTVPFYFARVVGVPQGTLNLTASALGGAITTDTPPASQQAGSGCGGGKSSPLVPIGVQCDHTNPAGCAHSCGFSPGGSCSLTQIDDSNFGSGRYAGSSSGNWDCLALGGWGSYNLQQNTQCGYTGTVQVNPNPNDTCPGGNSSKCVCFEPNQYDIRGNFVPTTGCSNRISNGISGGTCSSHDPKDCRSVTTILVDWNQMNSNTSHCAPVLGFGQVWVNTPVVQHSHGSCSQNWVSENCPGGSCGGPTTSTPPNCGATKCGLKG
jgi:Flp pilus assembly protein TadG